MYQKTKEILERVIQLREVEKKSFEEIGFEFGLTGGRASQIYKDALKVKNTDKTSIHALSVRAWNCLNNMVGWSENITTKTRQELVEIIKNADIKEWRNCGNVTYKEILDWAGLPIQEKKVRIPKAKKVCPHCGKDI
jgi:hypothetical protein